MRIAVAVVALAIVAACSASPSPSLDPGSLPPELAGLPLTVAEIGALELAVAVAETPAARRVGLMSVADLGPVEGMAFVFEQPADVSFHMRNVLLPLDIAFVDAGGAVLAVVTMPLCADEPCPTFRAPEPIAWALEAPAGTLAAIRPGDRFELRPWSRGGSPAPTG